MDCYITIYISNSVLHQEQSTKLAFEFHFCHYLGRYSVTIADLALKFPRSFHQYNNLVPSIMQENSFNQEMWINLQIWNANQFTNLKIVLQRLVLITTCKSKQFQRSCNHLLMKEKILSSQSILFYQFNIIPTDFNNALVLLNNASQPKTSFPPLFLTCTISFWMLQLWAPA